MVLTIDRLGDERNSNTLDFGWLNEAELLYNAPNEFRRDSKLIFGTIPRFLLINEGAHDVPSVSIFHQLSLSSIVVFC